MLAIRGIYTGKDIRLSEAVHLRPNIRVIVTFLEDEEPETSQAISLATEEFLRKCGGWEDERTSDEIITEIYAARTALARGADIFNRNGA